MNDEPKKEADARTPDRLQLEIDAEFEKLANLHSRIDSATTTESEIRKSIEELSRQRNDLSAIILTLKTDIDSFMEIRGKFADRADELTSTIAVLSKERDELKNVLSELTHIKNEAEASKADASTCLGAIQETKNEIDGLLIR